MAYIPSYAVDQAYYALEMIERSLGYAVEMQLRTRTGRVVIGRAGYTVHSTIPGDYPR